MTTFNDIDVDALADNAALAHYGILGMKWGKRSASGPEGVSPRTNREARKDAEEFTRAKLFYGEGAGTRRKLIKNVVEGKSKRDPNYKKAFDHHVENTDLAKRAGQARSERKRKNVKKSAGKGIRGTSHILRGNAQYASAATAIVVGGALAAHRAGIDKMIMDKAKMAWRNIPTNQARRGAQFLRDNGF